MVELFPRSSFDVTQGCANSGPGGLGILEVTWMDGLGFSLCAAPLDIIGPVFQSSMGQKHSRENEGLVCNRQERGRGT